MAITVGDIYQRSGDSGSFTDIKYVQGGWKTVPSASDLTANYADRIGDGQIMYVENDNALYKFKYFSPFAPGNPTSYPSSSFAPFTWPGSGGSVATGSLLVTASADLNTLTFERGDGTTFAVTINTGSGGSGGSGIFVESGSSGVFTVTSSLQITGSTLEPSPYNPSYPDPSITSSQGTNKYAMVVSESVYHYNDNIGVPTSKAWKSGLDGSYFNNFDHNSDTSEILRFMAGLLSSSAPDTAPNTKTFNTIGETFSNNGTGTAPAGRVPSASSNDTILYLTSKGFTGESQTIFDGLTINNNSLFNVTYSSSAGGSTTVSSSNDSRLFGLGRISSDRPFNVSGSITRKFINNNSDLTPVITSSQTLLSISSPGTLNGLTLANIDTGNDLIPAAFQDGKFEGILEKGLYNNSIDFTTTGSIGFYEISASIKIQSGSSPYTSDKIATERIFYAPISNLNTAIPANSITINNPFSESISATSRSLSGAPYLLTANWRISSSVNNIFNPMYTASTVASYSESDSLVTLNHPTNGSFTSSLAGGTVQTENSIFNTAGVAKSLNSTPEENDIIRLTASVDFNAGTSGATNIQSTGFSSTTFGVNTNVVNKNNSSTSPRTDSFHYFDSGSYGQIEASGSMAYYGRAQGYDGGTLTGTTEQLSGEDFRIQINDNLLSGSYANGDKFTLTYDISPLAKYDLQVKPEFLVTAGGSNGYWLNAHPTTTDGYKYYARAFQISSGVKTNLSLSVGQELIKWSESTNDSIAAAVMLESAQAGTSVGGYGALTKPKLYDFATLSGGDPAINQATSDQLNPFNTNIDVGGNQFGSKTGSGASTTYNMPMKIDLNQVLADSGADIYTNYIILIGYKGNPTPIQTITVSY